MTNIAEFTIDIEYCTSVMKHKEFPLAESEEEQIIYALKYGSARGSSTWSEDHPEFTKLREQLGSEGFIEIQRGWWNGDRVINPFVLNDKKFKKGAKFCCSDAIRNDLERK